MAESRGLVFSSFIAVTLLFFAGNEKLVKDLLTELYYNLSVEILSKDNNEVLKFDALTDLCTDVGVRFDMKKQTKEISKKYDFFY